jgi:two-component system, LuxR family, response regulator FixJ
MTEEGPLIAVVDDEKPIRNALSRLLRLAGLKVETFVSGSEFLESVKDHAPDCVVLDLNMPETDGFEVENRLTEAGLRIPIVVITGRDVQKDRERMTERGVAAFLQKPLDGEVLLAAINIATKRDSS